MIHDHGLNELTSSVVTKAKQLARSAAFEFVEFLCTRLPAFWDTFLLQTGPQIGIRESRHSLELFTSKGGK